MFFGPGARAGQGCRELLRQYTAIQTIVERHTSVSLSDGSDHILAWDTLVRDDPGGCWFKANPTIILVPQGVRYVKFTAWTVCSFNDSGGVGEGLRLTIAQNGANLWRSSDNGDNCAPLWLDSPLLSSIKPGDQFTLTLNMNGVSTPSWGGGTSQGGVMPPYFAAEWFF